MRSFYKKSLLVALGLFGMAGTVEAAEFGSPSLLPIPAASRAYPVSPVGYRMPGGAETLPSPSDRPAPTPVPENADQSVLSNDYQDAMTSDWSGSSPASCGAPSGQHYLGSYSDGYGCEGGVCNSNRWFGGVNALVMTRNHHSGLITATDQVGNILQGSCATNMGYTGGIDATLGRMFGCDGTHGIMVNYWGLYPQTRCSEVTGINDINTPIQYSNLQYDDGLGGGVLPYANRHNGVCIQKIEEKTTINSFEVNFIGNMGCNSTFWGNNAGCYGAGCNGSRLSMGWAAGIRYFQFNEGFGIYSDTTDQLIDGDQAEACYHIQTRNNMLGFQLGSGLNYCVTNRLSLYGMTRVGIFGNNVSQCQYATGTQGDAWVNGGVYNGQAYRVSGRTTDLAFIGQLDLGARWQVSRCWSVNAGYRIVGLTGVALATQQVPTDFGNLGIASVVNNNGSAILNGAYIGATMSF